MREALLAPVVREARRTALRSIAANDGRTERKSWDWASLRRIPAGSCCTEPASTNRTALGSIREPLRRIRAHHALVGHLVCEQACCLAGLRRLSCCKRALLGSVGTTDDSVGRRGKAHHVRRTRCAQSRVPTARAHRGDRRIGRRATPARLRVNINEFAQHQYVTSPALGEGG